MCSPQATQTFSRSGVCSLGLFHTTAQVAKARHALAEQIAGLSFSLTRPVCSLAPHHWKWAAIRTSRTLSEAQRIPALTSSMAAMIPGVSQPEIQRQVRQQRADIDALYELAERVDQKVDALDVKVDRRFDEISGQLSEVLRQLGGR